MREWVVPGYSEIKALGSGGFGDVVLAQHDASGTLVAIKYLHRALLDDPGFAEMFRSEARVLASLDDPNVVRLYEYVESPSGAAIVMELIDGVSLRQILTRQGKTSAQAALIVLQGSLLGLAAAHARGVVHRDYKPENVLVGGAGASKLTDFGIAARAGGRPLPAGTLAYAPPEQFGGGLASPAGDVYAATATFYECLTGRPPFTGDTTEALLHQHLSEPVPLEPVPEPMRQLVAAGMAKDPAGRPADAASFITELRAAAWSAYGEDWEDRGRSHLGEALLLLAALWPSSTGPAVQGHAVEQVHLSHGPESAHQTQAQQHLRHLEHLRHLHHEHVEHLRHLQHLEHEKHLGQALPNGSGSSTTAEPGAQGTRLQRLVRNARHANRPPRWLRRALPDDPSAGLAFAIVAGLSAVLLLVVGVAATITATGGSGPGSGATSWHTVRTLTDPTTGNIKSMAISPTGGLLATGSFDGSSYLWNLASGQLVARVTQPSPDGVASLAFSPDGKILALGLDSGTIVLRDVATMGTVATFSDGDGQGAVSSMAFSPDGATLAAADLGSRGTFLWDVATGRQVALLNAQLGAVTTAVFSPDGKTLATGGDGGTVLWNIAAGAQIARLGTSASGPIISAAFSPDGSTIATGGFNGAVLWNVATARQVAVFAYPPALDDTVSVAFSPDGTVLATAGVNTPLWATATRANITTIHVTASEIAFSPKGKLLATVTGQRVIVWAPAA